MQHEELCPQLFFFFSSLPGTTTTYFMANTFLHYCRLLSELALLEDHPCEATTIQQCFNKAYQLFSELEKLKKNIEHEADLIFYYKQVAPPFLAKVYYYQLRYYAALFVPEEHCEKVAFWQREGLRLPTFMKDNASFCTYFLSGATGEDAHYFSLQSPLAAFVGPDLLPKATYELPGYLLALQKYHRFVLDQLT